MDDVDTEGLVIPDLTTIESGRNFYYVTDGSG